MSRRPLPTIPRGPGREVRKQTDVILGCPRDCPVWQLQAIRALIKPQFKNAIMHRSSAQTWTARDQRIARRAVQALEQRLTLLDRALARLLPEVHFPNAGDFRLIATYSTQQIGIAKFLATQLSRAVPGRWFVVGKLLARDGKLYRRTGLRKLEITPLVNPRLGRILEALVKSDECEISRSTTNPSPPDRAAR